MNGDEHADIVVVGSGFGGAVAACRLAPTGRRVVVLERGRDWSTTKTPQRPRDYIYSSRMPHLLNGWLDLRVLDQMVVATGAGVGGGSLIYANVCVNAPDQIFCSGWPSQITANEMLGYYRKVAKMLKPQEIPTGQVNPRMALLRDAATALGVGTRYRHLPLAVTFDESVGPTGNEPWRDPDVYRQGTCVHCGNCVIGCEHDAKNTLDKNYLKDVIENKYGDAEIRPLSMVTHIEEGTGGSWRVHYLDLDADRCSRKRQITAKIVILAAGSIGSTEILLRSRDGFRTLKNLPRALGKGWSPNGDFLTLAKYEDELLEPTKGPTIGAVIDLLDGVDLPDDNSIGVDGRIYVEDGGLPNVGAHLLNCWKDSGGLKGLLYRKASALTDFSDMVPWFGQSIDAADGEFSLRSPYQFWRARTRLNWNPQQSVSVLDTFKDVHVDMTIATGGEPIPLATWSWLRMLVTPHPLGGCNMAAAPGAGVTNHMGEVFGYDNLFVLDGAVIPRAIGRNPSKTIAAVAERSCERLIQELPRRLNGATAVA